MRKQGNRKRDAVLFLLLAIYICGSCFAGFPLGFGKWMERSTAKEYCDIVYPEAQIGKTVFNPVGNGYETAAYLEDEKTYTYIGVSLAKNTIYDPYREEAFLQETGVAEVLSRLTRTHNRFFFLLGCLAAS